MKCDELLGALNDYIDGDTRSALCEALREHLAGCDPCRVVIDNIRQTITVFQADRVLPLPPELHNHLRRLLKQQWAARFPACGRPHDRNPT